MASSINDVAPVKREVTIQELDVVVTISPSGILVQAKGDRHRTRRGLLLDWDGVLDYASPVTFAKDKEDEATAVEVDQETYEPVGFLRYGDEKGGA